MVCLEGVMVRGLRNIVLIVVPVAVALSIASASAFAVTLPGCANPAEPALNQYCENVPSASGPQPPSGGGSHTSGNGTVGLGATLSPRLARQLGASGAIPGAGAIGTGGSVAGTASSGATASAATASGNSRANSVGRTPRATDRQANQRLLALPAPARHNLFLGSRASTGGAASFASASTGMIVILASIALALACTALVRRRRQPPGPS